MKEIMYFVIRDVPNVSIRHMRETGGKLAVRCDLKIFTSCDETKIRMLVLRRVGRFFKNDMCIVTNCL